MLGSERTSPILCIMMGKKVGTYMPMMLFKGEAVPV
jgi:hypothetical protein